MNIIIKKESLSSLVIPFMGDFYLPDVIRQRTVPSLPRVMPHTFGWFASAQIRDSAPTFRISLACKPHHAAHLPVIDCQLVSHAFSHRYQL